VAVPEGINAVPAPTVSKKDGQGVTFSCDYEGVKYVVSWKPKDGMFAAKLSIDKKSWNIGQEDGKDADPYDVNDIDCGFFDLDGNGSLELVVYDSGSNGSLSFYRIDPKNGPVSFAWAYTGGE
jgi:hypothetical protein